MHLSDKNVLKIEYKKKSFAINKFYRAISSIFYNVIFFFLRKYETNLHSIHWNERENRIS